MAKVNNRLKKLKYKSFKRLRSDIWGTVGIKNKKNQITNKLKSYLEQDFKFKIKNYTKAGKTKAYMTIEKKKLFTKIKVFKKRPFYVRPEFDFNVVSKAKEKRRKRVSYRGLLLNQRRKFLIFFGEHFNRKKLRKITTDIRIKRSRFLERRFVFSFPSNKSFGHVFGSRLDLTLFRSNFCSTMRQCRQLIKHKKVNVMRDNTENEFFLFRIIKNLAYRIPLFTPIKLINKLQLKRKNEFRHLLLTNNTYYASPKDLFIDYFTFISFRIFDTNNQKLPFGGNINYFVGISKFY